MDGEGNPGGALTQTKRNNGLSSHVMTPSSLRINQSLVRYEECVRMDWDRVRRSFKSSEASVGIRAAGGKLREVDPLLSSLGANGVTVSLG